MQKVVKLQHANGSWDLTQELAETIGRNRAELRSPLGSPEGLLRDFPEIWATALALAWLDQHAGHLQSEWRMVADKGRRWLDDTLRELSNQGRWAHEATKFLRS